MTSKQKKVNETSDGPTNEYYKSGNRRYQGVYKDGQKYGLWTEWYDNEGNDLESEGEFAINDNGMSMKTGIWTTWHRSGFLESEGEYNSVNGQRMGKWSFWYVSDDDDNIQSLEPQSECYYDGNGVAQGMWKTWYRNNCNGDKYCGKSRIKSEEVYVDGKAHGPWTYYHKNGIISSKGRFVNGKRQGLWEEYYDNGQIQSQGTYVDTKMHGMWQFWNASNDKSGYTSRIESYYNNFQVVD